MRQVTDIPETLCDRFLMQVQRHQYAGDYYPDPRAVGGELQLSPALTQIILAALRVRGWIAKSPYHSDHIRITTRGWEHLLSTSFPKTRDVVRDGHTVSDRHDHTVHILDEDVDLRLVTVSSLSRQRVRHD